MRAASKRIHATRIQSFFLRVSLSQNRCALLGDTLQPSGIVADGRSDVLTSVDVNLAAGHVGRLVRAQEIDDVRDLRR